MQMQSTKDSTQKAVEPLRAVAAQLFTRPSCENTEDDEISQVEDDPWSSDSEDDELPSVLFYVVADAVCS